jgi:hypothetical protein
VSCIGEAGVTIDLGNGMYLATEWLLTAWCLIGLPVLERGMLDSRVIISHDKFNGRDAANERSCCIQHAAYKGGSCIVSTSIVDNMAREQSKYFDVVEHSKIKWIDNEHNWRTRSR